MASVSNAKLTVSHDHGKHLVTPVVTCDVTFSKMEFCQMKTCEVRNIFKLRCQIWGEDGFLNPDDFLYEYTPKFFPDSTPQQSESVKFEVTLGESVLDEDDSFFNKRDEVYGKLILTNRETGQTSNAKTNVVKHHF
ncbi:MAG: hypothetical protein ACE5RC_02340 [Nitrosopumilus sp.]